MSNEKTEDVEQARDVLDNAVKSQSEEKPKSRKKLRTACIIVLIIAVPCWWFCLRTPTLRISEETTYVLGPIRSDGKGIDYFRAIEEWSYPPEMKTDENGYRMIVRACGDMPTRERYQYNKKTGIYDTIAVDPEPYRLQVYEKLGLDPNEPVKLKLESPDTVLMHYDMKNPAQNGEDDVTQKYMKYSRRGYWKLEELPELKEWLEESGPGIDLLGEAVRKPVFRMPMVRENEDTALVESVISLSEMQLLREFARAANGRAQYRIGIGDIDGAIYDALTILHMERRTGKNGPVVSLLVGIAVEGIGHSISIGANPEFSPSREQLEHFMSELDKLPPPLTVEGAMEFERYMALGSWQEIAHVRTSEYNEETLKLMGWSIDVNAAMKQTNRIYDSIIDGSFDEYAFKPSWNPLRLILVKTRSEFFVDRNVFQLLPSLQASKEALRRCECSFNVKKLTLALLLYEKDHEGKLPEEDWRTAVLPYLGPDPEKYFHCPSCNMKSDETTYMMIGGVENESPGPNQILIGEVFSPRKMDEGDGRLPKEKAQVWKNSGLMSGSGFEGFGSYHAGGFNIGTRGGGVSFMSNTVSDEALEKLIEGTAQTIP